MYLAAQASALARSYAITADPRSSFPDLSANAIACAFALGEWVLAKYFVMSLVFVISVSVRVEWHYNCL